ncbi:MAG: hypothetical protein R2791_12545 [Saprospiraceae bacterium]
MKKIRSWMTVLGMLSLSVIYFSFFDPPADPTLVTTIDNNNVASFTVNDLPTVSGTGSGLRIFLSHGDGTYFMGTPGELAGHSHHYAHAAGGYLPFAEVIAFYDDNKKPPKRTVPDTVPTSGTATAPTYTPPAMSNNILLRKTCSIVPGDSITYIITYEHPGDCSTSLNGTILFKFDDAVFDFRQSDLFGENEQTSPGAGIREYTFTNLAPGEQRSFFVLLETKATVAVGSSLSALTNVSLAFGRSDVPSGCSDLTFTDTIADGAVLSSHDPNHKTVYENAICQDQEVTWRIDFQNEGDAPETNIVVSDWIDPLLDFDAVQVTGHSPNIGSVSVVRTDINNREYRFKMNGLNLKGLGQRDVREDETKGYFLLKTSLNNNARCNAVANASRIFFGCNPPVFTETALAPIPCDSLCGPCTTLLDTILPVSINPGKEVFDPSMLPPAIHSKLNNGAWYFKWYPGTGLSDPFTLVPVVDQAYNRTYTLVASSAVNCERIVVRVPLKPDPPLTMAINKVCLGSSGWKFDATAQSAQKQDLIWNDCSTNINPFTMQLPSPQRVYVGVWDTLTDRVAEAWIIDPSCSSSPACSPACIWAAVALIALLLFLVFPYIRRNP